MKIAQTLRPSFWRREHHLDKMTLRELVVAYFQYPAIIAYLALSVAAIGLRTAPILMPFAEGPIDVDRQVDWDLANRIVAAREAAA